MYSLILDVITKAFPIIPSDNLCQVSPSQIDTHQYGHHGMLEAHHMNNHQIDLSINSHMTVLILKTYYITHRIELSDNVGKVIAHHM